MHVGQPCRKVFIPQSPSRWMFSSYRVNAKVYRQPSQVSFVPELFFGGAIGYFYKCLAEIKTMRVPSEVKKCVVYIGLKLASGSMKIVGTGFFLFDDITGTEGQYIVTAKHVIQGITNKGLTEIWIRTNLKENSSLWHVSSHVDWKLNSDHNIDIAILHTIIDPHWDHLNYRLSSCLTDDKIIEKEIDIGDEVFIIGLFKHHQGQHRNIPIARIGNISAMIEEKIQTNKHLMEGYLIEARSIGGLSGSPVFVNLGEVRFLQGSLQQSTSGKAFYLMGIVYGHYDIKSTNVDEIAVDEAREEKIENINTGIAIVTPVAKILETIIQ